MGAESEGVDPSLVVRAAGRTRTVMQAGLLDEKQRKASRALCSRTPILTIYIATSWRFNSFNRARGGLDGEIN